MKMEEKLLKIYNHFGEAVQIEKLREEVEELIEAIKEDDKEHISEELADVLVLVYQVAAKKEIKLCDIMPTYVVKIDRTLDRMESKYYEQEGERCK